MSERTRTLEERVMELEEAVERLAEVASRAAEDPLSAWFRDYRQRIRRREQGDGAEEKKP